MRTRPLELGDATFPLHQKRLREIKGEPTQERWLLLACRDKEFDLAVCEYVDGELEFQTGRVDTKPYTELWSSLADLKILPRKYWCVGWRMHYAFDRADFLIALERGEVKLPAKRVKRGKAKHTGKLTYNKDLFEVDAVCGRNKIKFLDWCNYKVGVAPEAGGLDGITLDLCFKALVLFLDAARQSGVAICKSSVAQLGWYHARSLITPGKISVNRDPSTRELERRAYHGGRNEAFVLGDIPGTTYSLDVKSCYAAICKDELLPCRCCGEYRAGCDVSIIDTRSVDHWIADVLIKTDVPDYPLRWQGTPIYPIGEFVTALAWPELKLAIERGHVVRVLNARRYEVDDVLRRYAMWYFKAKSARPDTPLGKMQPVVKAMFNASLGYSARQKYDWVPWHCQIGHKYWLGTTTSPDDMQTPVAAQILDREKRWLKVAGEPFEAMPFLHAAICSYARVRLLDIFAKAGRENILYCDTDGILVNRSGREALERSPGMMGMTPGQLVERFAPGHARIQGQKSYSIGKEFIQAGVVKTMHSAFVHKRVLATDTGRVDRDGRVWPFEFQVEKSTKPGVPWANVLK